MGSSIALTQRPSIFCIRLPQEATFLFQFYRQIDNFCHFRRFFFQIPAFKALTERSKVTFSPNAPNFEPKFGFSPNDPSFFEIVFSPNAPAFGSVSLTPISIWYWSSPTPNQWSSVRMGVICSCFFFLAMRRAAQFWTLWRRFIWSEVIPVKVEFKYKNQDAR